MRFMRLLLIRHGQTASNIRRLLDTAPPGPGLTELGEAQAAALVDALDQRQIDALYVSTALRTQQTAQPLAEARGLVAQPRAGVCEISAGELEMSGEKTDIMRYVEAVTAWMRGDLDYRMPGAETGEEVLTRFEEVLAEARDSGYQDVVIVSHGGMIRTWAGIRANNIDPAQPMDYDLSNTGMVLLQDDSGDAQRPWRILEWTNGPAGGAELADDHHDGPDLENWEKGEEVSG